MEHLRRAYAWASRLDTFLGVLERALLIGAATAGSAALVAGLVGGDPLRFVGVAVIAAWLLMAVVVAWHHRERIPFPTGGAKSPSVSPSPLDAPVRVGAPDPVTVSEWAHDGSEAQPDDVPPDWTGPFWRGKQIIKCPWDDYRTTSNENWNDHQETHTDPPEPQQAKEIYRVPRQWAKQAIHYLGGTGGPHYAGVPADPDNTLYVTEAYAQELATTGLYARGPVEKQAHALVDAGTPPRCKCGHEARNTAWFQSHLHENGIT